MRRANLKSRLRNPRSPASPRRADSRAKREKFSSSLFLDLTKGGLLVRPFVLDRLLPLGARTCGIYRRDNPVGVLVLFLGLSAKREQVFPRQSLLHAVQFSHQTPLLMQLRSYRTTLSAL